MVDSTLYPESVSVNLAPQTKDQAKQVLGELFRAQGQGPTLLLRIHRAFPSGGKVVISAFARAPDGNMARLDHAIVLLLGRVAQRIGFRQSFGRRSTPAKALALSLDRALALPWAIRPEVLPSAGDQPPMRQRRDMTPETEARLKLRAVLQPGQRIYPIIGITTPGGIHHVAFMAEPERCPELGPVLFITEEVARLCRFKVAVRDGTAFVRFRMPETVPLEPAVYLMGICATKMWKSAIPFVVAAMRSSSEITEEEMAAEGG